MTKDEAFKSFELGKKLVEKDYKAGKLSREQASQIIKNARENYRNMKTERELNAR